MSRNIIATISQSALRHNLKQVKSFAPGKKIIAMVKANAYGHGLPAVARTLRDVDAFGVACMEEALVIREQKITTPIILMEGFFNDQELALIEAFQLTTVVHSDYQVKALEAYQGDYTIPVWIKLNSGMNRLGFTYETFAKAYKALLALPNVKFMGFMGHFPSADDKTSLITQTQCELFQKMIKPYPGFRSLANSAAILHWKIAHEDWVRPGLMLYGASPFPHELGQDFGLEPVMELSTEIIAFQTLHKGDKVGYSGTFECPHETKTIAIVGAGYGDGYPWHAQNGTPVLIRNQKAPLVGRVSMDMTAVDVSSIQDVKIGDKVTLWGKALPVEEIAHHAKTVPWELFCRLTERSKIVWVD